MQETGTGYTNTDNHLREKLTLQVLEPKQSPWRNYHEGKPAFGGSLSLLTCL